MAYLYLINSSVGSDSFKQRLNSFDKRLTYTYFEDKLLHCSSIAILTMEALEFQDIRVQLDNEMIDYVFSEKPLSLPQLVVFDMDSTLIPVEVIDELAAYAGKKSEVSEVTELAMQGQLDFNQSLKQRVKHLTGLDENVIAELAQKLQFNPGVKEFCEYLIANGSKLAIASGGFEPFAKALQKQVDFTFIRANKLEVVNHRLSGNVIGTIINAEEKAKAIEEWSQSLDVDGCKTLAVGDGANDLLMLKKAAIGIAYKAKPKVNQSSQSVLKYSSMAALIDLLECTKAVE